MNPVAQAIEKSWQRRGLLAWILSPVALVFGLLAGLRRGLYAAGLFRSEALPVPVIVVGNITAGGSGKTPLIIVLTQTLKNAGLKPGIVSRGYGGTYGNEHDVMQADANDARRYGDEAVLIAEKTGVPVFVSRKRVAAAQLLLQHYPDIDVILCDDGLQHYALNRDIELALFDERGPGNGWLLPAGPLREPLSRLLQVNAVVLNGEVAAVFPGWVPKPIPAFTMQLNGSTAYRLTQPSEQQSLVSFKASKLVAAAGIGNPQRYFRMLRQAGLEFSELPLPDHYDFHVDPFAGLDAEAILITEKDAVKCKASNDARLWVVPVQAEVDPALISLIAQRLSPLYPQFAGLTKTEKPLGSTPA